MLWGLRWSLLLTLEKSPCDLECLFPLPEPDDQPFHQLQWRRGGTLCSWLQILGEGELGGRAGVPGAAGAGAQGQHQPGEPRLAEERSANPSPECNQPDPETCCSPAADPHQAGHLHKRKQGERWQEQSIS